MPPVASHVARSHEPPCWKLDTYSTYLTAGKYPCSKEIKKAQHGTKWESDEKDSAQLPRDYKRAFINKLEIRHYAKVKALTRVNTKR
jgi:hypothetical protein